MSDPSTLFSRAYPPAMPALGPALLLLFQGDQILLREREGSAAFPVSDDVPSDWDLRDALYLGTFDGLPILADDLPDEAPLPEGLFSVTLRALYGQVSEADYALAGYAAQLLYWRRTSKFCPVCGHATEARDGDWGRKCPQCGHVGYPRVSPAVLILVHDEGKILLGHKPGWGSRYSILAGFVEPNESLEDCVRREVLEEVDVTVADVKYTGSQPWPFPHQVMIGFTARYAEGDVKADEDELDDARWFTPQTLPDLPPPVSLSRQMIDAWMAENH